MRTAILAALAAATLMLAGCSGDPEPGPGTTPVPAVAAPTTTDRPDLTDEQTDTVFLRVLDSYGIDYGNDDAAAIRMAASICDGFDRGLARADMLPGLQEAGAGYSAVDATNFMDTAIVAYCPQHG